MLKSPENFHLYENKLYKLFNRLSLGKLDEFSEKRKLVKHFPKYPVQEFNIDWTGKKFNRIALMSELTRRISLSREVIYLEIGCAGDKLFQSVNVKKKTGVDPFSGGTHRMTSDDYFAESNDIVNLVFVDGLHEYQQVWRDVQNALSRLEVGGYIALHDMLPRNWVEANVPCIKQGPWTGDVWKIAFDLMATDGINFNILNIDFGVGVVCKLQDRVQLAKNSKLDHVDFLWYSNNRKNLPIIEYEEFLEFSQTD